MFEGNYQRRRQINLGNNTREDKAATVRRTQRERRAREEERSRIHAAIVIQSFYRSAATAHNAREQLRSQWDLLWQENGDIAEAKDAERLELLLRMFIFFYRPKVDISRALLILPVLQQREPLHSLDSVLLDARLGFKFGNGLLDGLGFDTRLDTTILKFFCKQPNLISIALECRWYWHLARLSGAHVNYLADRF